MKIKRRFSYAAYSRPICCFNFVKFIIDFTELPCIKNFEVKESKTKTRNINLRIFYLRFSLHYFDYVCTIIRMTDNTSLLLYARLTARLEHFMSLRGRPSALFGIYTCVVLSLLFILYVLCEVRNKFTLPYLLGVWFRFRVIQD